MPEDATPPPENGIDNAINSGIDTDIDTGPLMSQTLPIHVVEAGNGRFVIETEMTAGHLNLGGAVHGGFLAAFADIGCTGGAAAAAAGGLAANYGVTISLTTNFVAAAAAGRARCEAACVGGGRRTKTVEARIYDVTGALVAFATAAVRLVDVPKPREA
jgi:uncharacterized protein (TIGR00369 family)